MPVAAILSFQNEANFSPREAYLLMKISCKFGEASWCSFPLRALTPKISLRVDTAVVVNAKPKYPPDASSGYNNPSNISVRSGQNLSETNCLPSLQIKTNVKKM